jgi:hypothetical protein
VRDVVRFCERRDHNQRHSVSGERKSANRTGSIARANIALNETVVPSEKPALQAAGQLIPAGLLVTDPLPEIDTISWGEEEPLAKAAETL